MNTMVLAGMVLALAVIVGDVAEDLNGIARARSSRQGRRRRQLRRRPARPDRGVERTPW